MSPYSNAEKALTLTLVFAIAWLLVGVFHYDGEPVNQPATCQPAERLSTEADRINAIEARVVLAERVLRTLMLRAAREQPAPPASSIRDMDQAELERRVKAGR